MFADVFGAPSIASSWSRISRLKLAGPGRSDTSATVQTESSVCSGEVEAQMDTKEIARRPSIRTNVGYPEQQMAEKTVSEAKSSEAKMSESTVSEAKVAENAPETKLDTHQ